MTILFANPSPSPRPVKRKRRAKTATSAPKRTQKKKGLAMAKSHRSPAQRAATRRMLAANRSRKRSHNPSSPRRAKRRRSYSAVAPRHHRRRRTHRNPAFKGILGELASMDGLILLGSAAIAPTAVNMIADKLIPAQYATGYTGLLGKVIIAGAAVWLLDGVAKQRKAAIGFAAGSLGTILADGYKLVMVRQALPAAVTATPAQQGLADEIAQNPTLYRSLMEGQPYGNSLNGYEAAPMGAYDMAPAMNGFESLN